MEAFGWALAGLLLILPLLAGVTVTTPALIGRQVFDGIVAAAFFLSSSACLLTADGLSTVAPSAFGCQWL